MTLPKVLVVDDDEAVRDVIQKALERHQFEVVTAAGVREALGKINGSTFDVLLCDLQMPGAGDGFTVASAMRHSNPAALTFILSGFPAIQEALSAILLQADEILTKPLEIKTLVETIRYRMDHPNARAPQTTQSIAAIIKRDSTAILESWLTRVEQDPELTRVNLNLEERTGCLPKLIGDLVLSLDTREKLPHSSSSAGMHGRVRREQRYSASMMVEESRILQACILETLQRNLASVDFNRILVDVMAVANEIDLQLRQAIQSYMEAGMGNAASQAA